MFEYRSPILIDLNPLTRVVSPIKVHAADIYRKRLTIDAGEPISDSSFAESGRAPSARPERSPNRENAAVSKPS